MLRTKCLSQPDNQLLIGQRMELNTVSLCDAGELLNLCMVFMAKLTESVIPKVEQAKTGFTTVLLQAKNMLD